MAVDPLFVQGVLKIMDVFLSVVAIGLCIRLFFSKSGNKTNLPWTFLLLGLLVFAFGEIMGALDAFGFIVFKPFLPAIELGVLIFLAIAIIVKSRETKGAI